MTQDEFNKNKEFIMANLSLDNIDVVLSSVQETVQCKRLHLTYVPGATHYDGLSFVNKNKIEYKGVYRCAGNSLTISNLNDKEHVNVYVAKGICDDNEHWFFIPKWELESLYFTKNFLYFQIVKRDITSEDKKITTKLVQNYCRGKMMIPKNYLTDNHFTSKKLYFRSREFTLDEIIHLNECQEDKEIAKILYEKFLDISLKNKIRAQIVCEQGNFALTIDNNSASIKTIDKINEEEKEYKTKSLKTN
jgi:hypothetical protein